MSMRYLAGFISAFYNPLKVPDAPTIGTATNTSAGGIVSVTFTAPANVGGGAITGYIATAKKTFDGTAVSATGTTSPITISGLTNGSAYTVAISAVNVYGPSLFSADSNSVTPTLLAVGDAYGGGFYAGQISTAGNGIADYNLVILPAASVGGSRRWKTTATNTPGTSSVIEGFSNSQAMNNADHPAAQFCRALSTGGFGDWYLPAVNEAEVVFYNLKPVTTSNDTSYGINPNAVPARTSNYTAGNPAQTSATNFKQGAAEAIVNDLYWTSTQYSNYHSWVQYFNNGGRSASNKTGYRSVRAIRRVAV